MVYNKKFIVEKLIDKLIFFISTDIVAISNVTKDLTIQNYPKSVNKISKYIMVLI